MVRLGDRTMRRAGRGGDHRRHGMPGDAAELRLVPEGAFHHDEAARHGEQVPRGPARIAGEFPAGGGVAQRGLARASWRSACRTS